MSCLICSAVCCSLLAASVAGIAMGYNYSLAEYIDLKETNVSVYLKRGVFDDEIGDEIDTFRRSAENVGKNSINSRSNEESLSQKSGRRVDDSMLQSNEQHSFEGSLMRLTAKPPDVTQGVKSVSTKDYMAEIYSRYSTNSLDQLKAIQSLINMRKANENRATTHYDQTTTRDRNFRVLPGRRKVMIEPDTPEKHNMFIKNKAIPYYDQSSFKMNPARLAVPDESVVEAANWFLPNEIPPQYKRTMVTEDYINMPNTGHTYPPPVRYKSGVSRPTVTKLVVKPTLTSRIKDNILEKEIDTRRLDNPEIDRIKNNLLMEKAKFPRFRKPSTSSPDITDSGELDYPDEAIKGLPVRRKRNIKSITNISNQYKPTFNNTSNKTYGEAQLEQRVSINEDDIHKLDKSQVNLKNIQITLPNGSNGNSNKDFISVNINKPTINEIDKFKSENKTKIIAKAMFTKPFSNILIKNLVIS